MPPTIDLNADVGEDPTPEGIARDAAMAAHLTSLNIACGGHAGDAASMTRLVQVALERGLNIGAHPSYPDRANFGRTELPIPAAIIEQTVEAQVRVLADIARAAGAPITHVKPHGALYHAARKRDIAEAIARACARAARGAILVGQFGSPALEIWRAMGFTAAAEAFADRTYEADGTLRARTKPGAVIEDTARAIPQSLRIACDHAVIAADGTRLPMHAATLCVHSDTPGASELARAIRLGLEAHGVRIHPMIRP